MSQITKRTSASSPPIPPSPGTQNLSFDYSSPTFTVASYDGTPLSATNICFQWVQSKADPGEQVLITATQNYTFTDGSTGTTDNQRFGISTGVDWPQDIPFFVYMIAHDTPSSAPALGISRNPSATVTPAASSIGVSGAIVNVGQLDFFLLNGATTGVPVVANYDLNPCVCIGSFRMRFTGATDSWTVQALSNTDGVGQWQQGVIFTFPAGQNGAAAGTYVLSNAGTEPAFSTNSVKYSIDVSGNVLYSAELGNVNIVGVGSQEISFVLPYSLSMMASNNTWTTIYYTNGTTNILFVCRIVCTPGNWFMGQMIANGSGTPFANSSFIANDDLAWNFYYKAFN